MSLWTPSGEHPVGDDGPDGGGAGADAPPTLDPESREQAEAIAKEMAEVRRQLASVPAAVVVANHAMGLYELAAIHLGSEPPNLPESRVAIDAFAALLNAVGDQLGEDGAVLGDALAQIRLAFVQISGAADAGTAASAPSAEAPADGESEAGQEPEPGEA